MSKSSFTKILFVIMLAMSTCGWSSEVHVEVGAGQTHYGIQPNGIWYQLGNPTRLQVNGHAWMIGLTGDAFEHDRWGVAWHADYINFGHASSHCYCTPRDDYYDAGAHRQLPGAPVPNANYVGSGSVQGLKLSLAPYWRVGEWKFGPELGIIEYRATWTEDAYGWSYFPGPTRTNHLELQRKFYNSKFYGAFAQRGRWTISYEHYNLTTDTAGTDRPGRPWVPALYTGANMLMVSYAL